MSNLTIGQVQVTLEVEGDDSEQFLKYFMPAVERWYRTVKERERADEDSRKERALLPPARR